MYIKELLKEADKSMENYKYDDALVYLKSVLEIDESNYSALMTLSKIYTDFGMFEEAKEYAEKLYKKYPESKDTLFTLGFVYQSLGRLKKAISEYEKLLNSKFNEVEEFSLYARMGDTMAYANNIKEVIKYYNIAINCENVEDYVFEDYFEILFRAEQYEEIRLLLLNYENATNENKELSRIKMLNLQGRFFVKIADYENAQKVCDKMIILEPENFRHYVNLAYVLELQHKYDEALECVDKLGKIMEDKEFSKELKKRIRKNKRKFERESKKNSEK